MASHTYTCFVCGEEKELHNKHYGCKDCIMKYNLPSGPSFIDYASVIIKVALAFVVVIGGSYFLACVLESL